MPGYGSRFWAERTPDPRRRSRPPFKGQHTADAVVIGGGLTGCTTAFVFASAGLKVVLLEAGRLAGGGTAASPGVIVPEPDARFRDVEAACGKRVARTAWKEAHRSATDLAGMLKRLGIKCDVAPAPFLRIARSTDDAMVLRREQAARKEGGVDAPWVTFTAVQSAIGTESSGAIRVPGAFIFDPVKATLGLAAAAESRGAVIFEKSAVRRTRFTRKFADVILAAGTIRTTRIVVATGEPGPIVGQLRRHVRRQEGFAVVTAPLTASMRREMGAGDAVVTEEGEAPHWWRWVGDDRLLIAGGLGPPAGPRLREKAAIQRTAQLMYELSLRYPAISGLPANWGWPVPVVTTPDSLPWIGPHRNYPFHFLAMAFGWHGDGLASLAARAALRHFEGESRREDEVFGFVRHL
jgi:glycine/D-amino acid oxidase-like deaminating enzyme